MGQIVVWLFDYLSARALCSVARKIERAIIDGQNSGFLSETDSSRVDNL
jgi:hypothetical protein